MQTKQFDRTITLGFTGASGAAYGLRLLSLLVESNCRVFLLLSRAARVVLATEADVQLPEKPADIIDYFSKCCSAEPGQITFFDDDDWFAPVASGSGAPKQMVICPCTAGTVSAIAHGASDNLLERAADVVIKERGQLILVPREMPYSTIHLENMLSLSRTGVTIMPASPGFYNKPVEVTQIIDSVVGRILDHLQIEQTIHCRWGKY
ncbi:MAG: UbiX family flavin prenyltransferase [Deltaproteobacteria bacterium]|nr:UbiX family flavin prenyltransferase [Deltaproteobacteria bacterium]